MEELIAAGLIVLGAGFVQGLSGFGFGLVAMSLLPLFRDVAFAVPFVSVLGLAVSLLLAWQLRHHISARRVSPLIGGAVLGIPLGVLFLKSVDPAAVKAVLGVVLIGYAAYGLRSSAAPTREVPTVWGLAAGFAGGVLGGAFNTSGPPVVAWSSAQAWHKDEIKATLQAFFAFSGTFALVGFAVTGLVTRETLTWNALLFPLMVVGTLSGSRLYARVDQHTFRRLLLIGLGVMGVVYLAALFRG